MTDEVSLMRPMIVVAAMVLNLGVCVAVGWIILKRRKIPTHGGAAEAFEPIPFRAEQLVNRLGIRTREFQFELGDIGEHVTSLFKTVELQIGTITRQLTTLVEQHQNRWNRAVEFDGELTQLSERIETLSLEMHGGKSEVVHTLERLSDRCHDWKAEGDAWRSEIQQITSRLTELTNNWAGRGDEIVELLTLRIDQIHTELSAASRQFQNERLRFAAVSHGADDREERHADRTPDERHVPPVTSHDEIIEYKLDRISQIALSFQAQENGCLAADRRQHPRMTKAVAVSVTPLGNDDQPSGETFEGMLYNISQGGLAFLHTRPVSESVLIVNITLSPGTVRRARLHVLRCDAVGRFYVVAGKFAENLPEDFIPC